MATRPAKRARISLACIPCREQKTRCDGGKPRCGCCQRKDPDSQIPCVYHNQAKARESKEIQKLLHHISVLERKLAVDEHHDNSPGTDRPGTRGLSQPNVSQPFPRTYANDGAVPNDFPTPHITESGRTITEGVGQASLSSPLNGVGHRPDLSQSNHSRGHTASERLYERDPRDLQQLDNLGNQHASANNDASGMLPTPVAGFSRTETKNAESQSHSDQESFLRGYELDARYGDPQGAGGGTPQGENGPYFSDRSSNTVLMQEVNDIISPVTCTDQNTNTERSRGESSIYSARGSHDTVGEIFRKPPSYYLSFRHHMKFFELPPRSLADHLLDSYFNRVHLLYPFLHRPTFEAAYEQLWAPADQRSGNGRSGEILRFADAGLGSPTNSGQQTRIFYAGVNAIFALSCQFSDLSILEAREAAKVYLERAMTLLLDTEQLDNPTLSLLQLLLLLCLHLQGTPLRNRLWNIMGMASRMAQGIGLQFEGSEHGNTKSILEIEIRRRTWYSCVMMDLTISTTLGRPAMSSSGFTTPFPQAIDDENLCSSTSALSPHSTRPQVGLSLTSFFVETIKLWELTDRIVKALYPDTATRRRINNIGPTNGKEYSDAGFDVLVNLETAWTRLYNDLPQELRWSRIEANSIRSAGYSMAAPESTRKWLGSQQSVLQTRFLYVKLLIYRPLFLRVYREKNSEQMKSSETQISQHTTPTTIQSHFATRFATECFQTAEELVTLVHKLHRTKGANAWWYTIFYESWVLCQEILNHMIIYGNHAKRCLASLQALRLRLAAWESGSDENLQNQNAVLDHRNIDRLSNVSHENPAPMPMYDSAQFEGREAGRNDVPLAPGNVEFEAADDWAGALPWDADLDNWWTYETVGEDFAFDPTPL